MNWALGQRRNPGQKNINLISKHTVVVRTRRTKYKKNNRMVEITRRLRRMRSPLTDDMEEEINLEVMEAKANPGEMFRSCRSC